MSAALRPRVLGLAGTIAGFFALSVLVLHFFLGPVGPAAHDRSPRELLTWLSDGPASGPTEVRRDDLIRVSGLILGLVGLGLGVASFLRREDWRAGTAAVGLGSAALIFQFALVVFGTLVFIALIAVIVQTHLM